MVFTRWIALSMPSTSSGAAGERPNRSNHDGILIPMFRETGVLSAVGSTYRVFGSPAIGNADAHPAAVSPEQIEQNSELVRTWRGTEAN
jgi:hypothetical protein